MFSSRYNYYDTLYRLTSMAVHTSPRSLNEMFGDGGVLDYKPTVDGLKVYLAYATSITLYTLHEITKHFSLDSTQITRLHQRLESDCR